MIPHDVKSNAIAGAVLWFIVISPVIALGITTVIGYIIILFFSLPLPMNGQLFWSLMCSFHIPLQFPLYSVLCDLRNETICNKLDKRYH